MKKIGLVYDQVFFNHETGDHPENSFRLEAILDVLGKYGLRDRMPELKPQPASLDQLTMYHTPEYINRIKEICLQGGGLLDEETIVSAESFDTALMAAGAVITGIDQVMKGKLESAFALVRPPGHHALAEKAMGFCLFNNIAVGALYAKEKFGLDRIMIIDWDAHHGNGTSAAFYDTRSVLYFSTHQQASFPGTGWVSHVGAGEGRGYTINVPLAKGTGDPGYYIVFSQILLPVIKQYKPQLILISAGFDSHFADPMSGLEITCAGFAMMAQMVKDAAVEVCNGRVVLALEGGYNLDATAHAAASVLNVFGNFGLNIEEPVPGKPGFVLPTMRIPIDEAIRVHGEYWKLG